MKAEYAEADVGSTRHLSIHFLLGATEDRYADQEVFQIGNLASEFGVSLRTIRFYESCGILKPTRKGTMRQFSRRDRARLRLVLLAKLLGFSIKEARQIIEVYDQPDGKRLQMEMALDLFQEQQQLLLEQKTRNRGVHSSDESDNHICQAEARG